MPNDTQLYKKLQRHPTAPNTGFDLFIVGEAANRRAELMTCLTRMLSCDEPTCGRLILADNGNGKTLLHKTIQDVASKYNHQPMNTDNLPVFEVLFSHVSLSQSGIPNIGVELAKALRRSYKEPAHLTYASIATEVLRRFSIIYKSPWRYRWFTAPTKIALKYVLKKYDDYIHDVIESSADVSLVGNVDRIFRSIDSWLRFLGLHKDFDRYARSQPMSGFLRAYIQGSESGYRSVEELNQTLYQDLAGSFGRGQPQDIVYTLSSMARSVGCKVLVLQIDDCNEPEALDFLLPIVEQFESFCDPKIFIMASAIKSKWEENVKARGHDRSAEQKLTDFFNPFELTSPNPGQLSQLADKLEVLIQLEEAQGGHTLNWSNSEKLKILNLCNNKTYRQATKIIIDSASTFIH